MMIIKAEYDTGETAYVCSGRRPKHELLICWGFVSAYFHNRILTPPYILITASGRKFKGSKWVWIKIKYWTIGMYWRHPNQSFWHGMLYGAERRVRKLYRLRPTRKPIIRKLYYRIEMV